MNSYDNDYLREPRESRTSRREAHEWAHADERRDLHNEQLEEQKMHAQDMLAEMKASRYNHELDTQEEPAINDPNQLTINLK